MIPLSDRKLKEQMFGVRYDPFDMGTAYAYVKGQWIRCISQYYKSLVKSFHGG